jgi:D-alanyl-D-alanine carboxypeptidase
MQRQPLLSYIVCLVVLIVSPACAEDCADTVVIDSVTYRITDLWCGKAIDTTLLAEPEDLVQLPEELTFEDYRIYVLPQTRDALVQMAEAAAPDSIEFEVDSGWRSFGFQRRIIKRRMAEGDSFEEVLNSVAPPGYSEHHTGRALDLVPSEAIFAFSKTYLWLQEHAAEYGFYETLPEDPAAPLTWESWHWTYLGDVDTTIVKPSPGSTDN